MNYKLLLVLLSSFIFYNKIAFSENISYKIAENTDEVVKPTPTPSDTIEKNTEDKIIEDKKDEAKKEKENRITFFVTGDTGTGAKGQYDVAKAIENKCEESGCNFGILLGDNIYNSGVSSVNDKQFIEKFEKPYKNLDMKIYLTLGNHDYRGNVQAQIDYTKKSKKWVMLDNIYNFSYGNTDFFCIDTNIPSQKQIKKVQNLIENSKNKWKIAFGHHPRYTNGIYTNATGLLKELIDKPMCNKVDFYLSGHEHNKQLLKPDCGINYLILGSGSALRTTPRIKDNTLFSALTLGFAWFEITDDKILVEILDEKGKIEYQYSIQK
ncbi:MAG: metallophosphoesterase [Candidatus Sericytochromatia bacterium]